MIDAQEKLLDQKNIAVVGISRSAGYGNRVFRNLRDTGYDVYPVSHHADTIDGVRCYHSLDELPEQVGGVVIVVPPEETEKVVSDCIELGINNIWMQPGAESSEAVRLCENNGISVVYDACILMYPGPKGLQRWGKR